MVLFSFFLILLTSLTGHTETVAVPSAPPDERELRRDAAIGAFAASPNATTAQAMLTALGSNTSIDILLRKTNAAVDALRAKPRRIGARVPIHGVSHIDELAHLYEKIDSEISTFDRTSVEARQLHDLKKQLTATFFGIAFAADPIFKNLSVAERMQRVERALALRDDVSRAMVLELVPIVGADVAQMREVIGSRARTNEELTEDWMTKMRLNGKSAETEPTPSLVPSVARRAPSSSSDRFGFDDNTSKRK